MHGDEMPDLAVDFLFVVDKKDSPLWRAASSRSESHSCTVIAATDFPTSYSLAKYIREVNPSIVIVSWRPAFDQLVSRKRSKRLLLNSNLSVYLLIPDFVGIHKPSEQEQSLIYASDGFLVTSNLLRLAYLDNYQIQSIEILHDLPNLQEISKIQQGDFKIACKVVLWVGNSKWGERLGFIDHKGLNKLAIPVFEILKQLDSDIEIKVIDSAKARIANSKVLEDIQQAACLLVTSDSEGTGLPILEAAALGTPAVTVNVGIASEILIGELESQIVSRDPRLIAERITHTINDRKRLSQLIHESWHKYRLDSESELRNILRNKACNGRWRESDPNNSTTAFIVWFCRYIRP